MLLDLFQDLAPHAPLSHAPLPHAASMARPAPRDPLFCLFAAAENILILLSGRNAVSSRALQEIMTRAFGGSDAAGAWAWKDAYDALEIAQARYILKYADTLGGLAPAAALRMLERISLLCPTHARRSEESQRLQQFSTPIGIGYIAARAAQIHAGDTVLEPSAGTGLLAVMAQMGNAKLVLNELAAGRSAMLARLFPKAPLSRHNAEYLADCLDAAHQPTVALMNPPFSASPNAARASGEVTMLHILAALRLLPPDGRLVAITGEGFSPSRDRWRDAFVKLQAEGTIVFSAGIAGRLYAKHGTTTPTRLTVIERRPAPQKECFPVCHEEQETLQALLALVEREVPPRIGAPVRIVQPQLATAVQAPPPPVAVRTPTALEYVTRDWLGGLHGEGLYEPYEPQTIVIPGAMPHPSPLVQSAAMASICGPKPSYRPHLYPDLVTGGVLSAAQLESVIHAGEAHALHLKGHFKVTEQHTAIRVPETEEGAVRFRRGWYLGDGTGCGKGRQVAAILLDNWLKGRRRAVWVSKNDKLLEDARRPVAALGGCEGDIAPQSGYKSGAPITLPEGILFTTYATLAMAGKGGKESRLEQITRWLGADFQGCILFDEAHAMANAVSSQGSRGAKKPSAQGLAGLDLQHALPDARIVYVSATGATTVSNLAYAARLGLWGTDDIPFSSQAEFVAAMEKGGIAAMEMISRDLKALGLYAARSLSYEGIEYQFLDHALTPEQIAVYDAYADAYRIIHHNIEAALAATNVNDRNGKARNGMAKAGVRSAFESCKQRFFNHLLIAMKTPSLLRAMEADIAAGHACVIQIVSTNEALMERRLDAIPVAEWRDLRVDITPREYVLDYLHHAFPVHLHEVITDEKGNETTRLAKDAEGQPVVSRQAVARRDALIEKLASMPSVQGALDQIIHHFGHESVAEVTGRGRRIVRVMEPGADRLCVETRPASANLAETRAFQDDRKRILVFSEAGGTGRSYHADRGARNQRQRIHYVLSAGWRADSAVQGLGRTNQANQPKLRLVASDVKGEKRFLSTIARRLDTLGAITRGQRETGGQGLFRESDNLESAYARAALRELFKAIVAGQVECCSLERFEEATALPLRDEHGAILQDLPPIPQFLNRVLALPIALQNALFEEFDARLCSRIEEAKASGQYAAGVETIVADGFTLLERHVLQTHAGGAETVGARIERRDRARILPLAKALALRGEGGRLMLNAKSGRAAVCRETNGFFGIDGIRTERFEMIRPAERTKIARTDLEESCWREAGEEAFAQAWEEQAASVPAYATRTLFLVSGLLLPVWDKLPQEDMEVVRLRTDDGQSFLGRLVKAEDLPAFLARFGLEGEAGAPSAAGIMDAFRRDRKVHRLPNGLELRPVTVMNRLRLEVTGFRESQKDRLRALGCFAEIIQWALRLFVPVDDAMEQVIERLLAFA